MAWKEEAREEIEALKTYFVEKHGWAPRTVDRDDGDSLDLFVTFTSRRLDGRRFVLRLRYQPDWKVAGRRETFVNPDDPEREGIEHWPVGISGINPQHNPPCICLRGAWGYHSVLHTDRPMGDSSLLNLLVELQEVFDQ